MSQMNASSPEWSYRIDADDINDKPQSFYLSADEQECKDIARRLNVDSIERLEATLNISREAAGQIYVEGSLKSKVIQKCVVSMDPVEDWIEEEFDAWFADKEQTVSFVEAKKNRETKKGHAEVEITEEHEDPEPLHDGFIEAGELVTQYLSLAINPYPHAEGATHEYGDDAIPSSEPSEARKNPFEALKNWKGKS
ncbi:MAG: hypothetical protein AAF569_06040 [Pseudomonadota bacterium]